MERPLQFAHYLLEEVIKKGDTVIDATVGNGYDTAFLAKSVGKEGKVYGFDIQKQAIKSTKNKLESEQLSTQTNLYLAGHEKIDQYLESDEQIQAATFNLGYLPRGDKSIITLPETTLAAINQCLNRLTQGGLVAIMVYFGHDGGKAEKEAVTNFARSLDQKKFTVYQYQIINQVNEPPFLLVIEKK